MNRSADDRPAWIGPDGQIMRRLELHLSYACPQRCWFCSEEGRMRAHRTYPVTWGRVARTLRRHARRGITSLHLTGGEPTIHPDFVRTLALARKLGMATSVGTNGHRLSERPHAEAALAVLDEIMFSLHGPRADLHDRQTSTRGSFDRVMRAISHCSAIAPTLSWFVNIVVTRRNIDHLEATVALAASLGAKMVLLSNPSPEGAAEARYADLAVPLDELASKLPRALGNPGSAVVRFFGVPMCLLGEHALLSNDLHWDPRATVEWIARRGKLVYGALYTWTPGRRRVHVVPCDDCAWKSLCAGIFDRAAEVFGSDALRPHGG